MFVFFEQEPESLMLPTVKRTLVLITLLSCLALGWLLSLFSSSAQLAFISHSVREPNVAPKVTPFESALSRDRRCSGSADEELLHDYTSAVELRLIAGLLDAYRRKHKSWRVALLRGDRKVKTLTWVCDTFCGGIGDRVKGIVTSLLLASLTDRLFLIKWSTPFDPEQQRLLFQPAAIDWDMDQSIWKVVGHNVHVHTTTTASSEWTVQVFQRTVFNYSANHVTVRTNIHYRKFFLGLSHFDSATLRILHEKGLRYWIMEQLQERNEKISGLVVRFLFRLSDTLQPRIVNMTSGMGLGKHPYVGVHLRTGFYGTLNENPKRFGEFHHKEVWQQLLDCALEKGEALLGAKFDIVLLTDSNVVKEWAIHQYKGKVLVTGKEAVHFDKEDNSNHSIDAALQAGAELGILAYSSILFASSSSGFSHVAREYCGIPERRTFHTLSCQKLHNNT